MKKDITKDFTNNLEKVYEELNKLDKDMFTNNQRKLDDALEAYNDYKMSLNYN